ncbi:hypothetical protein BDV18DRAFT_155217 [Aspergillus unguis]
MQQPGKHSSANSRQNKYGNGGVLERGDEIFHKTLDINVKGAWYLTTEFLRHIKTDKELAHGGELNNLDNQIASVVMIGSSAGTVGFAEVPHYSAAKHAVVGLTRSFAKSFGPYGVRFNCVCPGATQTEPAKLVMKEGQAPELKPLLEMQRDTAPLRRFCTPEEQAEPIIFFLSEKSTFVTMQYLLVNGGWC